MEGCLGFDEMKVELVLWIDSAGGGGWTSTSEMPELAAIMCRSVGFLCKEDKASITLVTSEASDQYNGSISIPKVAVVARRTLGHAKQLIKWAESKT